MKRAGGLALLLLALLQVLYWRLRLLGTSTPGAWVEGTQDIFMEHHPMLHYAARVLHDGVLPHWNPYQLCGTPLLAVPYSGVLYPPHVVYLLLETAVATEVSLVLHLCFAALCSYLLARRLGASALAGTAGALTFVWSGRLAWASWVPATAETLCWLPATVLLVDLALERRRLAATGLALAVCAQILAGSPEGTVYNLYAAGLYAAFGLGARVARGEVRRALGLGAVLLGAVALGAALAAPQLLPSRELADASARAQQPLTLDDALLRTVGLGRHGRIPPAAFLDQWLGGTGRLRVGVMPAFAFALGLGFRRFGRLFAYALVLCAFSALMVFGGRAYALYFETPIGGLFRMPVKFAGLFAWGQALLVVVAVSRLEGWAGLARAQLWREKVWLASLGLAAAAAVWLAARSGPVGWMLAALGCLLLFGAVQGVRLRRAGLLALVACQGLQLFLATSEKVPRPVLQAARFDRYAPLLERLAERAAGSRIYLSPAIEFDAGLTAKQGTLRQMRVVTDYAALPSARHEQFFLPLAETRSGVPFTGSFDVGWRHSWQRLDLTSTRIFVLHRGEPLERLLRQGTVAGEWGGFRRLPLPASLTAGHLRVYERPGALPRAYFASQVRLAADATAALAALDDPAVIEGRAVVLELPPGETSPPPAAGDATGEATIRRDSAERVEIDVAARGVGMLVLTDSYDPNWRAFAGGRELPVYRANHLFRAVPVPAGATRVRFEYEPRAFHRGVAVGAVAALVLLGAEIVGWRRRRSRPREA